jgi:hypothetical protein
MELVMLHYLCSLLRNKCAVPSSVMKKNVDLRAKYV